MLSPSGILRPLNTTTNPSNTVTGPSGTSTTNSVAGPSGKTNNNQNRAPRLTGEHEPQKKKRCGASGGSERLEAFVAAQSEQTQVFKSIEDSMQIISSAAVDMVHATALMATAQTAMAAAHTTFATAHADIAAALIAQ